MADMVAVDPNDLKGQEAAWAVIQDEYGTLTTRALAAFFEAADTHKLDQTYQLYLEAKERLRREVADG